MTLSLIALLTLLAGAPGAQPVLQVGGALPKAGNLTLADLEGMAPVKAPWAAGGETHELYGVPVDRILGRLGFEPGAMGPDVPKRDKRKGWRMAVVATAGDGFGAAFSCAELFETMGPTRALVVWKVDGKPLPPERGPLRLVVPTDKEPSRSLHDLRKLEVVDLRAPAAPAGR